MLVTEGAGRCELVGPKDEMLASEERIILEPWWALLAWIGGIIQSRFKLMAWYLAYNFALCFVRRGGNEFSDRSCCVTRYGLLTIYKNPPSLFLHWLAGCINNCVAAMMDVVPHRAAHMHYLLGVSCGTYERWTWRMTSKVAGRIGVASSSSLLQLFHDPRAIHAPLGS